MEVFKLKGQSKGDHSIIARYCKPESTERLRIEGSAELVNNAGPILTHLWSLSAHLSRQTSPHQDDCKVVVWIRISRIIEFSG